MFWNTGVKLFRSAAIGNDETGHADEVIPEAAKFECEVCNRRGTDNVHLQILMLFSY